MSEKKDIRKYLKYYIGCECKMIKPSYHAVHELHLSAGRLFVLSGKLYHYFSADTTKAEVSPILSKLEDMSEEELQECGNMVYDFSGEPDLNHHKPEDFQICAPEQFHYLLSKGYDLFGLIESGLAIDKKTQQS